MLSVTASSAIDFHLVICGGCPEEVTRKLGRKKPHHVHLSSNLLVGKVFIVWDLPDICV